MDARDPDLTDSSWLVAGGRPVDAGSPLNTPMVPASNFLLGRGGAGTSYARGGSTPTWRSLELVLGGLEDATALCFASGMAAVGAVFEQVPTGGSVVIPDDCYQGVASVADLGQVANRWTVRRLRTADTNAWLGAIADGPDLVWLETPSNPLLEVADLVTIAAARRKPGSVLAVDNTFATPLNQRPLDLGADVAVQSVTKFLAGHSDLLGGVVTSRDERLLDGLDLVRTVGGSTPGTLESFLALRGVRTLALRLGRSQATAGELAVRLTGHPAVARVRYPGLPDDPGHERATAQLRGFGAIVTFEVAGGEGDAADAADEVCRRVRLITHATSLGGVESTLERRAVIGGQEHLPPGLIRMSVGIEDVDDLWTDLARALTGA